MEPPRPNSQSFLLTPLNSKIFFGSWVFPNCRNYPKNNCSKLERNGGVSTTPPRKMETHKKLSPIFPPGNSFTRKVFQQILRKCILKRNVWTTYYDQMGGRETMNNSILNIHIRLCHHHHHHHIQYSVLFLSTKVHPSPKGSLLSHEIIYKSYNSAEFHHERRNTRKIFSN